MAEFLDAFKRRVKKIKRVRFQIPGTKSTAGRNNLERHLKHFPDDLAAFKAYQNKGGLKQVEEISLGVGAITEFPVF